MTMAPICLSASIKHRASFSYANGAVLSALRARREYVLVGFGEGGHEPEGCTKGELVLRREHAGLRVVDIDRKETWHVWVSLKALKIEHDMAKQKQSGMGHHHVCHRRNFRLEKLKSRVLPAIMRSRDPSANCEVGMKPALRWSRGHVIRYALSGIDGRLWCSVYLFRIYGR